MSWYVFVKNDEVCRRSRDGIGDRITGSMAFFPSWRLGKNLIRHFDPLRRHFGGNDSRRGGHGLGFRSCFLPLYAPETPSSWLPDRYVVYDRCSAQRGRSRLPSILSLSFPLCQLCGVAAPYSFSLICGLARGRSSMGLASTGECLFVSFFRASPSPLHLAMFSLRVPINLSVFLSAFFCRWFFLWHSPLSRPSSARRERETHPCLVGLSFLAQ